MDNKHPTQGRRRFLGLVGGSAVMLPFAGLVACSGEESAPPTIATNVDNAPATRPDPATPAAPEPEPSDSSGDAAGEMSSGEEQVAQKDTGGAGLPQLDEDDPQAKSLNYKHIASDIDSGKQPRYKDGQKCSNCQVYQGKSGDEWGPCPIFAGKAVKATGWCSAYAPMSA